MRVHVSCKLKLDPLSWRVRCGDASVELTEKEFRVFSYLSFNEGKVTPCQEIVDRIWDGNVGIDTLHSCVEQLCVKLAPVDPEHRIVYFADEGYCYCRATSAESLLGNGHRAAGTDTNRFDLLLRSVPSGTVVIRRPDEQANNRTILLYRVEPAGALTEKHCVALRLPAPDETPCPAEDSRSAFPDREVVAVVRFFDDNRRTQGSTVTRDEFVEDLSHEIKTSVTAILGGLHVLLTEGNRLEYGEGSQLLKHTYHEARSLANTVASLPKLHQNRRLETESPSS